MTKAEAIEAINKILNDLIKSDAIITEQSKMHSAGTTTAAKILEAVEVSEFFAHFWVLNFLVTIQKNGYHVDQGDQWLRPCIELADREAQRQVTEMQQHAEVRKVIPA